MRWGGYAGGQPGQELSWVLGSAPLHLPLPPKTVAAAPAKPSSRPRTQQLNTQL